MQFGKLALLLCACAGMVACGPGEDEVAQNDAGAGDSLSGDGPPGAPCVSLYADSDEVAARGRLVQLDITLRYQATRTGRIDGSDTRMSLDAESLVEGTASQLACAWDMDGGAVRYELDRVDGDATRAFPGKHAGSVRLSGTRVTEANGATVREEVDMSGPLALLVVRDVGIRETPDADVCVILAFDAPLQGRSLQTVTAPGIRREEPMNPSGLVLDGYSALSPRTFDGGDHRFANESFAICTGKESTKAGHIGQPKGLSISDDGLTWRRRGAWLRHASAPAEQRTIDFTMRVVRPTLPLE